MELNKESNGNYEKLLQEILEQINTLTIITERNIGAFEGMNLENIYTLLNNSIIINKFVKEVSEHMLNENDFDEVFYDLEQLCQLARREGYFSLEDYVPKKQNQFLKNILTIYSERWSGNDKQAPFLKLSYWITPYLLSHTIKGKEFIDCVLYYEGIMMMTAGGYSFDLIKYRLFSLLGKKIELKI